MELYCTAPFLVHYMSSLQNVEVIPRSLDLHTFKLKGPEVPSIVQPQSETKLLYLGTPMQNDAHVACMLHAQNRRTELLPAYVCDVGNGCLGVCIYIRITCAYVLLCSIICSTY